VILPQFKPKVWSYLYLCLEHKQVSIKEEDEIHCHWKLKFNSRRSQSMLHLQCRTLGRMRGNNPEKLARCKNLTVPDFLKQYTRNAKYRGFFFCLTDERWPNALPTLRRTPCVGEVEQSMTGARQKISVIETFRSSCKISLGRRAGANCQGEKKPYAYVLCSINALLF